VTDDVGVAEDVPADAADQGVDAADAAGSYERSVVVAASAFREGPLCRIGVVLELVGVDGGAPGYGDRDLLGDADERQSGVVVAGGGRCCGEDEVEVLEPSLAASRR
jgi:hypothetical protein